MAIRVDGQGAVVALDGGRAAVGHVDGMAAERDLGDGVVAVLADAVGSAGAAVQAGDDVAVGSAVARRVDVDRVVVVMRGHAVVIDADGQGRGIAVAVGVGRLDAEVQRQAVVRVIGVGMVEGFQQLEAVGAVGIDGQVEHFHTTGLADIGVARHGDSHRHAARGQLAIGGRTAEGEAGGAGGRERARAVGVEVRLDGAGDGLGAAAEVGFVNRTLGRIDDLGHVVGGDADGQRLGDGGRVVRIVGFKAAEVRLGIGDRNRQVDVAMVAMRRGDGQARQLAFVHLPDAAAEIGTGGQGGTRGHARDGDGREDFGAVGRVAAVAGHDVERDRVVFLARGVANGQRRRVDDGVGDDVEMRVRRRGRAVAFRRGRGDGQVVEVGVAVMRRADGGAAREAGHAGRQRQRPGAGGSVIGAARRMGVDGPARLDAADLDGQGFGAVGVFQRGVDLQRDRAVFLDHFVDSRNVRRIGYGADMHVDVGRDGGGVVGVVEVDVGRLVVFGDRDMNGDVAAVVRGRGHGETGQLRFRQVPDAIGGVIGTGRQGHARHVDFDSDVGDALGTVGMVALRVDVDGQRDRVIFAARTAGSDRGRVDNGIDDDVGDAGIAAQQGAGAVVLVNTDMQAVHVDIAVGRRREAGRAIIGLTVRNGDRPGAGGGVVGAARGRGIDRPAGLDAGDGHDQMVGRGAAGREFSVDRQGNLGVFQRLGAVDLKRRRVALGRDMHDKVAGDGGGVVGVVEVDVGRLVVFSGRNVDVDVAVVVVRRRDGQARQLRLGQCPAAVAVVRTGRERSAGNIQRDGDVGDALRPVGVVAAVVDGNVQRDRMIFGAGGVLQVQRRAIDDGVDDDVQVAAGAGGRAVGVGRGRGNVDVAEVDVAVGIGGQARAHVGGEIGAGGKRLGPGAGGGVIGAAVEVGNRPAGRVQAGDGDGQVFRTVAVGQLGCDVQLDVVGLVFQVLRVADMQGRRVGHGLDMHVDGRGDGGGVVGQVVFAIARLVVFGDRNGQRDRTCDAAPVGGRRDGQADEVGRGQVPGVGRGVVGTGRQGAAGGAHFDADVGDALGPIGMVALRVDVDDDGNGGVFVARRMAGHGGRVDDGVDDDADVAVRGAGQAGAGVGDGNVDAQVRDINIAVGRRVERGALGDRRAGRRGIGPGARTRIISTARGRGVDGPAGGNAGDGDGDLLGRGVGMRVNMQRAGRRVFRRLAIADGQVRHGRVGRARGVGLLQHRQRAAVFDAVLQLGRVDGADGVDALEGRCGKGALEAEAVAACTAGAARRRFNVLQLRSGREHVAHVAGRKRGAVFHGDLRRAGIVVERAVVGDDDLAAVLEGDDERLALRCNRRGVGHVEGEFVCGAVDQRDNFVLAGLRHGDGFGVIGLRGLVSGQDGLAVAEGRDEIAGDLCLLRGGLRAAFNKRCQLDGMTVGHGQGRLGACGCHLAVILDDQRRAVVKADDKRAVLHRGALHRVIHDDVLARCHLDFGGMLRLQRDFLRSRRTGRCHFVKPSVSRRLFCVFPSPFPWCFHR